MEVLNHILNMTYLTEEEWANHFLPKINNDKSFFEEIKQIIKIQNLLIEIIQLLFQNSKNSQNKLKQHILYSSIIYYYKYCTFNDISLSTLSESEKLIISSSCIFLAFKEAKGLINLDIISGKIQPYLNKLINEKNQLKIEEINNLIIQREYEILYSIEFNMGIDNPYEFLYMIKLYFQEIHIEKNDINEIIELTNKYINDSILFPLYLYYTSYEIALSCVLLLKETKKYSFIDIDNIIKLYKLDIDANNIFQCARYISKITKALNNLTQNKDDDCNSKNYLNFNNITSINTN